MGSDPAPHFASLFLYYVQSRWIKDLQKKNLLKARKLCNVFRFMDDLNAVIDAGMFKSNFWDIYLEELRIAQTEWQ